MHPRAFAVAAVALGLSSAACLGGRSPYALDYAAPAHITVPTERYRLANGLEVMLSRDPRVPFVAVDLWYHAGSKDDPPGRAGLAHLFEHLMFDGSRHVSEAVHAATLATIGARDVNAETHRDHTSFHETVPSADLELALWLESDRMAYLLDGLDQDKLDRERKVVENELRQHYADPPYGMVPAFVWAALFPEPHPYHHLPIGDVAQLDAVTLDDARGFFSRWYMPSNCTLTLVGDFEPASAKALLEKYFGSIAAGAPPPARPETLPSPLARATRLFVEADVPRARIDVAWPVVPQFAPGSMELELGAHPLDGYLTWSLVKQQKLASRVNVWMDAGYLGSVFEASVDLEPGVDPDRALAAFDECIHSIRAPHARYNRADFAVSRAQLLTGPLFSAERFASRAELLQRYNEGTGQPEYASTELTARQFVDVEDVRKAYYDLLRWDRRVVTVIAPRSDAPRAGWLARST